MKGMLQSLEAVIGILLITSVIVTVYARDIQFPEFEDVNLKLRGFAALQTLDNTGELRKSVVLNDTITVENKLVDLMPPQLNLKVIFCERECATPNIAADKLMSVTYLVAGDANNISPR